MFGNLLKTLGPRLLGGIFAGVATYVAAKTSGAVQIDPAAAGEVVTGIFTTYLLTHRITSSIVNPGDASKGRLAEAEKRATDSGSTVIVPPPSR
jgi:hypothetical protein